MNKLLPIILIILLILPAARFLFGSGYFSMHDDLQVMRLYEMEKCMRDGQIPCRWVADMGAGYGFPLFNFYSPLPYYAGMMVRLLGASYIDTVKILFAVALLLSGVFMYFLVKEFAGKMGGIVAGVLYVYVPYHAVQVYVRGALGEAWGALFFPLILWAVYKFVKEERISYFIISIFAISFLLLSHNLMSLVFIPVAIVWAMIWLVVEGKLKSIFKVGVIFVWASGLSAFFIVPAFFEQSLVKIDNLTSDYYNFELHFASVRQLFLDRSWGYGPSKLGFDDKLSFQLGWPHWWVVVLAIPFFVYLFLRKEKKTLIALGFGIILFFAAAFMIHAKSYYFWKAIPLMPFVQFPWRFLTIAMLASSFVGGIIVGKVRWKLFFGIGVIVLVLSLNISYFRPMEFYPTMTDEKKLSGFEFEQQSKAAILDYLPKQVGQVPQELAPNSPQVISGEADVSKLNKRSDFWHFDVNVFSSDGAGIVVPIFDFSDWQVLVDGKPVGHSASYPGGVIEINIPEGKHIIVGWFKNTRLRVIANTVTMISFAGIVLLLVFAKNKGFNHG